MFTEAVANFLSTGGSFTVVVVVYIHVGMCIHMQNVVGGARGDIMEEKISVCCWVDVTMSNLTINIIR